MNKNLVPLLVVGLLLLVLGVLYGPRLLRGYYFQQTVSAMLQSTRDGNLKQAMSSVVQSQQQEALAISTAVLGSDYHTHIQSLKLTDMRWLDTDTISATVTCKLEYGGANPIYQGKLLWHFQQGGWVWNFAESYVGEFAGFDEPAWVKLGEMLSSMENY